MYALDSGGGRQSRSGHSPLKSLTLSKQAYSSALPQAPQVWMDCRILVTAHSFRTADRSVGPGDQITPAAGSKTEPVWGVYMCVGACQQAPSDLYLFWYSLQA